MGIFENTEFTAKEKAELDLPIPEKLAASQIVQLWSDDGRRQEVFIRLMQQAIENRKLKIQQSKYNMLLYLNKGRFFDYSKVYKDGDELRVEWILNGVNGQCNSQVVISKYDFTAWFKSENELLPIGCLLEKWWKDLVPQGVGNEGANLTITDSVNKDSLEIAEEDAYARRKVSFDKWLEQSKVEIKSLKVEDTYIQVKQFNKQEWNIIFESFKRDFWQKYSKENGLNKKPGRPPGKKYRG